MIVRETSRDRSEAVRRIIEQREAINLQDVVRQAGLDALTVARLIESWVRSGLVEVIHPVGYVAMDDTYFDPARSYFRWRRPTDGDFLWEQKLFEPDRGLAKVLMHRHMM